MTHLSRLVLISFLAATLAPPGRAQGGDADRKPAPEAATIRPGAHEVIEVLGQRPAAYPGGQVARRGSLGVLGDLGLMDAPFSINAFTAQTIQNQRAATAAEVVANDPSVRVAAQPGGILDAFYVRGFPLGEGNVGEIAFAGAYGIAPNYRVLSDYVERIELLKGPAALLYGMSPNGGVGGVVNVIPKRAADADLTRLGADLTSTSQFGGHLDLSRRFGASREFGARVNAGVGDGGLPLEKQNRATRVGAAAFDYRGASLSASLDLLDQNEHLDAPSRPFLVGGGVDVPAAPDGRRNVTQAWEGSTIHDQSLLFRSEYALDRDWAAFAHAGGGRTGVDRLFGTPKILDAAGNVGWTSQRFRFDIRRMSADAGLRGALETGPVRHVATLQGSWYRDWLGRGSVNGAAVQSNLYAPIDSPAQAVEAPASTPRISESTLSGVALADALSLAGERLRFTLGIRGQHVKSTNFNPSTGAASAPPYSRWALTPHVGVVVKPWQVLALYANYVEGLSKGDTAPSVASNTGEVLAPYKATQVEAGVKVDTGRLGVTLSGFQITKPSGQLTGTVFAADAEQRNRGLELNLFGEPTAAVRLLGGITLIDAKVTRSSTAAWVGKTPVGVPAVQVNAAVEYDPFFLPRVTLTGGVSYAARQAVDPANTQSIPAWGRVDLGLRYRPAIGSMPVTLRAIARNVLDRSYWSSVASYGGLAQGAPRTLYLSTEFDL